MGLKERIEKRAADRAIREAREAAQAKAVAKAAKAKAKEDAGKVPPVLIEKIKGEPPDQRAHAIAQTDPQLFRDAEARAKAAAEINEARKQWAAGPAKVLTPNR